MGRRRWSEQHAPKPLTHLSSRLVTVVASTLFTAAMSPSSSPALTSMGPPGGGDSVAIDGEMRLRMGSSR